jgi:hypothetical protein
MSKWINAAKRKPKEGYVLCCSLDESTEVWIGFYLKKSDRTSGDRDGWHQKEDSYCKDKVTHWQRLPKLPKSK